MTLLNILNGIIRNRYKTNFHIIIIIICFSIQFTKAQKLIVIDEGKVKTSTVPPKPDNIIPASFDLLVTNQEVGGYISIEYTLAKDIKVKINRVYPLVNNGKMWIYGLNSVIKWHYISPDKRCTYSHEHIFPNPDRNQNIKDTLHIPITYSDLIMCQENARIYDAITKSDQYEVMPYFAKDNETIFDFEASKYEVSVEQFMLFVYQTGYESKPNKFETKHINPQNGNETADKYNLDYSYGPNGQIRNTEIGHIDKLQPVIYVNREDINAFLKWINTRDKNYEYRLPTANEWEYIAMGKADKINKYPWGNNVKIADQHANTCDASLKNLRMIDPKRLNTSINDGAMWTWSVNTGVPNSQGIYNIIGNVAEWTDTPLEANKKVNQIDKSVKYIFKGGSYFANIDNINVWDKTTAFEGEIRHPGIGFRMVRNRRKLLK